MDVVTAGGRYRLTERALIYIALYVDGDLVPRTPKRRTPRKPPKAVPAPSGVCGTCFTRVQLAGKRLASHPAPSDLATECDGSRHRPLRVS